MNTNMIENSPIASILSLSVEENEPMSTPPADLRKELFQRDVFEIPLSEEEKLSLWQRLSHWFWGVETEGAKELSFWDNLLSWFWGTQTVDKVESVDLKKEEQISPIPFTPVLDPPETTLEVSLPPSEVSKKSQGNKTSIREIEEILSSLSEKTIQKIMNEIMETQLELEKESAIVSDTLFSTYDRFRQLKEKTLEEVKEAILKDQNWAEKLKTPVQLAAAATFVCGLAAAAVTYGAVVPAGAMIGSLFGSSLGSLFQSTTHAMSTVAPVVAAIFASCKGLSFYTELKLDSETAQLILTGHDEKFYNRLCDRTLENVVSLSDREAFYQEWLTKFRERCRSLVRLLLQK